MKRILLIVVTILTTQLLLCNLIFAKNYDLKDISNIKVVKDYSDETNIADVGTVTLGKDEDGDAIEWVVLEKDGNKALLLSKLALMKKQYNDEYDVTSWEKCTIRKWLNSDFLKQTFSNDEQKLIVESKVINDVKNKRGANGGNDTKDKIFLLSIDEVEKYFPKAELGDKVIRQATFKNSEKTDSCWWLLRSPGMHTTYASYVGTFGDIDDNGHMVTSDRARIRPAMWVSVKEAGSSSEKSNGSTKEETKLNTSSNKLYSELGKKIKELKTVKDYDDDKSVNSMDKIKFGKYDADEEMEWLILEKDNEKATLLSKYIVWSTGYNNEKEDITWETCHLRSWLNSEFMDIIFSDAEKKQIIATNVETADNKEYKTKGGNDTKDKVYLLSIDEAKKLSKKVLQTGHYNAPNYTLEYYLRNPGEKQTQVAIVDKSGKINEKGVTVEDSSGLRIVINVSLVGEVSESGSGSEKNSIKEEKDTKKAVSKAGEKKDKNNDDEFYTGWDGDAYYKDGKGLAAEWLDLDGKWYYIKDDGECARDGWIEIDKDYYYFNKDGTMAAGQWIVKKDKMLDGKEIIDSYYVGIDGKMWRNTITPDGYTVDAEGKYRVVK